LENWKQQKIAKVIGKNIAAEKGFS